MQEKVTAEYAKVVVAQYLESHGFQSSLVSFLKESNLPRRALLQEGGESLEAILEERIKFGEHSVAQRMREMTLNDCSDALASGSHAIPSWDYALSFKQLELHGSQKDLVVDAEFGSDLLLLSTSGKEARIYDSGLKQVGEPLRGSKGTGVLRPCGVLEQTGFFYCCGLDGSLNVYGTAGGAPLYSYKIHGRMVTHAEICSVGESWFLVSCGMDNYLKIHLIDLKTLQVRPWWEVKLASACTALQAAVDQDRLLIYLTRNEHTHVICYRVDALKPQSLIQQYQLALNDASFTVHAFGVRDMKLLSEQDLLLVATSHTPHMRLLVVSLPHNVEGEGPFYDKVLRNMVTEVPQDDYSQPLLGVLPGASGTIVASTTGVYAVDVSKGDSWRLEELPQRRAKCLAISDSHKMVAMGFADKSVYIASFG